MQFQINQDRLAEVMQLNLAAGSHDDISQGMCVMEAVSYVAGEEWTDAPECACPVIAEFLRNWNDALPDGERDALLRDLIPQIVGTRSTAETEQRRAMMAADWLIREVTPAWLRLAKLDSQADMLAALPEIADFSKCKSLLPALNAVRSDAAAAMDAARAAAWAAAMAAAMDSARAAARAAAWAAAMAAAMDAAGDAAMAAAMDAAGDALKSTKDALQQSAKSLVVRMIELEAQP